MKHSNRIIVSFLLLFLFGSLRGDLTFNEITSSVKAADQPVSLVYFKGELQINSDKLEKSYSGRGEVKNISSTDIINLRGKAIGYWHGIQSVIDDVEFPITEVKAGESVPFFVWFSKVNFYLGVDDVKFTFEAQPQSGSIFVPALNFTESKAWQPGAIYSYRVSGTMLNRSLDNLENITSVMSFYNAQGQLIDYESLRLPAQAIGSRFSAGPVLNPGQALNLVFYAPNANKDAASYKIQFRASKASQQSQPVQVSDLTWKYDTDYGYFDVSGKLTNPSDKPITETNFYYSGYDDAGKLLVVDNDYFRDSDTDKAISLEAGQTKTFAQRSYFLGASEKELITHIELQALSSDRFDRASVVTGPGTAFVDANFQSVWNRTDKPISDGVASRSWQWGPQPFLSAFEEYAQAPGGKRLVQYFDKSRMEITNPGGDKSSVYYVTNGLIAAEMMRGQIQVGDSQFKDKPAAQIGVAGDGDDSSGPTYATLGKVISMPPVADGTTITATINRVGDTGTNPTTVSYNVKSGHLVTQTNHTIASPFWEFLNSQGLIYDSAGKSINEPLFSPIFYATGFPLGEAYWTKVKVGGQLKDVLVQAFERRVLTYTPSNSKAYQVEMGNVGQHYYSWRYGK